MPTPPSGEQFEIVAGEQRAVVVEVGGGIRLYEVAGRPVLDPYPLEEVCDGAHGAPLIPWPNRLADGKYTFDGKEHQLALSEPEKQNAIHGLLRWRPWRAERRSAAEVAMTTRLYPMQGYPFSLEVTISYVLSAEGLTVTTSARNIGNAACPFGAGQHPYLSPGEGVVDDCSLQLEAGLRILTEDARQLPIGREAVAGTEYDFSVPRQLGQLELDYPFTELRRDSSGLAWVRLGGPDGKVAELWVDERYPIVELYTGDTLQPARRRRGLGTEPMSCPPNAFRSGEGLVRLEPGEEWTGRFGFRLS